MSDPEFDSSASSVEDNVETDRNEEAQGALAQLSDDEVVRRDGEEEESENPAKAEYQDGNFDGDTTPVTPHATIRKNSDDDNDSDGETIKAVTAAATKVTSSYLSSDSEQGSPRIRKGSTEPAEGTQEPPLDKTDTSMADVFGESDEDGNNDADSGEGSSGRKRRRLSEDKDEFSPKKKTKQVKDTGSEGEEEVVELDQEPSEPHNVQEEDVEEAGDEAEGSSTARPAAGRDEDDDELEDGPGTSNSNVSDFDQMMQKRKEAMSKARRRRKKDVYITANDDHIAAMLRQMKQTAEEDRKLNLERKAATKKLQLLPVVTSHLKKAELLSSFIECGILSALADWLTPLPDHSLPNLKIRESILDILGTLPPLDSSLLKSSRLGKAVMLIYRHPKETRKNREKAGKLISDWARPIFGLASDFKILSRDEREERDYAHLQAAKRRQSTDSQKQQDDEVTEEPQKPGDKGWIGRARVPRPSNKDYVVRPKWNVEQEFKKSSASSKAKNRYEQHVQKFKQKKTGEKSTHAISISVEGRKMPL